MRKWVRRISCAFLTLLVLALLVGFTYERIGRARDASQLPPRVGQAIDIGGRTLNLYCSGQGAPTVILEAGGNSPGYAMRGCSPRSLSHPCLLVRPRGCRVERSAIVSANQCQCCQRSARDAAARSGAATLRNGGRVGRWRICSHLYGALPLGGGRSGPDRFIGSGHA